MITENVKRKILKEFAAKEQIMMEKLYGRY